MVTSVKSCDFSFLWEFQCLTMSPKFNIQTKQKEFMLVKQISKPFNSYIFLVLVFLPLVLLIHGQQSLMAHDEGVYANQALSILRENNWIDPANLSYDRTIGIQWIIALFYQVLGVHENTARLPSILASLVCILLTYRISNIFFGKATGLLSALILMTTHLWAQYTRLSTQDIPLVCVEIVGIWSFIEASRLISSENNPNHKRYQEIKRNLWLVFAGSTLGLGFFIKGFMIFPVAVAFLPYLFFREKYYKHLRSWGLYLGFLLGWIPSISWLSLSIYKHQSFLPIERLFGKIFHLSEQTYHGADLTYYLWNVPANMFPWFFFCLLGTTVILLKFKLKGFCDPQKGLIIIIGYPWLLMILLNLFSTRTRYYPLQVVPFFSILAAVGMMKLAQFYLLPEIQKKNLDFYKKVVINFLVYGFGGIGVLLFLGGIIWLVLVWTAKFPQEREIYGYLALSWGIPWTFMLYLYLFQTKKLRKSLLAWLVSWLAAPYFTIISFNLSGLWGNYSSELKTLLEQPLIAQVNNSEVINVLRSPELDSSFRKEKLLLKFYTKNYGIETQEFQDLKPFSYAWMSLNIKLSSSEKYTNLGAAKRWQLIQVLPSIKQQTK